MKRTAEEYAALLPLLDQALQLPAEARARWIDELSDQPAELLSTLRKLLLAEAPSQSGDALDLREYVAAAVLDAKPGTEQHVLRPGEHVGPYELVREIGRGGMGLVWLANRADGAFRRAVALKLPHVTWADSLGARLAHERDILAGLEHPNIARFYDAGVDTLGRPFMAMEYVEGKAIDEYCKELNLSIRARLALILDVAKAVAYAHSKLVVHRDLKPANMLVSAAGEVRLLDFGIAKLIESDTDGAQLTQLSGRLLTPDYASPEQIRGEAIGTATDVYSLAVVSYELLTGERPYRLKRQSAAELEQAITEASPRLASEAADDRLLKRQLRGDLDAILNKAMKKNVAERYNTVEAFAADLQSYLAGEPVRAQPDSAWYRMRKFSARHSVVLAATGTVLAALVVATSVSLFQAREANRQAAKATAIKDFLLHVFTAGDNRAAGSKPPAEVTALELLDEGSAELVGALNTQPAVKLELIEDMGDIYERMDAIDKELALYRVGVQLADASYGPNSEQKARLLSLIAGSLSFAGRWAESERAVAEAEQAFDASGDHRSLHYAHLLKTKGGLLRGHGQSGAVAARDTLQQAAAIFAQRYPTDEGYVGALMYLAGADIALDEARDAETAADQAVKVTRRLNNDASEQAHAISLRASIKDQLGDVRGAEGDYVEASKLYASSVGARHFFYAQNQNLLGQLWHLEGKRDEGMRLLELTTAEIATLRPASNTLANSLTRLSEAYCRDGAFDDANRSATEAIALKPTQQNSSLLARLKLDHAKALLGLGRFGDATAAVQDGARAAGADGIVNGFTQVEIDYVLAAIGLASNNLDDAQHQIAAAEAAPAGNTRRLRHQRSRVLVLAARIAAARGDLNAALAAAAGAHGLVQADDVRSDAFLRSDLATVEAGLACLQSPSPEAARSLEQALANQVAIQRDGSPLIAETQVQLGSCWLASGNKDRADVLMAEAARSIDGNKLLGPQFAASLKRGNAGLH